MPTGLVPNYLGKGLAADRPESLDLHAGCIGLYRATDTGVLSVWDGAWHNVAGTEIPSTAVARKTASYSAVVGDQVIVMDVASANTFTVPLNSVQPFPIGAFLEVWQRGEGQTTLVAAHEDVKLEIDEEDSLKLRAKNAGCSLRKTAIDTWRVTGKMEAAS